MKNSKSYNVNFLENFLDASDLSDLIEIIELDFELRIVNEHLKLWLHDSNTDLEHAHLIFKQNSSSINK